MRRLALSALLTLQMLSVACSSSDGTLEGDNPDGEKDARDGGVKRDGGRDGGKPSTRTDAGEDDPAGPPKVLTPLATPFEKDATNRGNLSDGDLTKLREGGSSCGARVLYPYDKTVFPAGLTPPTIMWEGATDGAYLELAYDKLETLSYQTAAGASDKGELTIDADDWNEIVRRTQGTDMLVKLSTKRGNAISTCNFTWKIAQGAMTGSIFYNTYDSPDNAGLGAIVRLTLGQAESETYLSYAGQTTPNGPCISCHSVSANGQALAASLHNYGIGQWAYKAASYEVTPSAQPAPLTDLPESTFGAFTPDGANILSIGNPDCTNGSNSFPRSPNNFPLVPGPSTASLHDTRTGDVVQTRGLKPEWFMWMPQFSPKGDRVAFNHAKIGADGRTDRRELAVMKYDAATRTFSDLQVVVSNEGPAPTLNYAPMPILGIDAPAGNNCTTNTPSNVGAIPGGSCTGPCYPAWPFFTPDGEGIIYSMTSEPDFMSAFPGRDTPAKSELWYVDIASKEKVRLDVANKSQTDADTLANYYPTMLPVQVGGYYWLFWTSTRPWGHRDFTKPGNVVNSIFGNASTANATKKRIWVSAIKPRAINEAGLEPLSDTSTPGFYLEGQSDSGNVRAFATLNPCQQEGSDCSSGLDCCTGFCNFDPGTSKGSCVPEKTCSDVNEKCATDEDCCPAPEGQQKRLCLGDFCGFQAL